jgi:hypothetical protein
MCNILYEIYVLRTVRTVQVHTVEVHYDDDAQHESFILYHFDVHTSDFLHDTAMQC